MVRRIPSSTGGTKDDNGAYVPSPSRLPPSAFQLEDFLFDKQLKFVLDPRPFKIAVCSRRAGKCRTRGTLVKTPTGSVPIERLSVGDLVYGYNTDGTVSLTKVTAVHDQGVKEVVDLMWNGRALASSTEDHRWLAHNTYKDRRAVKPLKNFNCRDKIATAYVAIPGGHKHVKEAYSLGAMLGDGCCREKGVVFSSGDLPVVQELEKELEAPAISYSETNYSWYFRGKRKSAIPFYFEWMDNKYAHEKTCNVAEIRTWTRESQLRFIAGLIDTDGSIGIQYGRLTIRIDMQAKSVIDALEMLFLDLFQVQGRRALDNRTKYKNGPIHTLSISTNMDAKRVLRELPTRCQRKQWKPEYEALVERNTNAKYVGFTLQNRRKEQCYDITIDNETHLYLDANGMIGHNTVACAADLVFKALETPDVVCLYITLSRNNAKKLIWPEIQKINRKYCLGGTEDGTELSMKFPNGSMIYLSGAKDQSEIEKFRGLALKICYIDECQSFRAYIRDLIDDIISPALMDYAGTLALIGTPGPVLAGYFAELAGVVKGKEAISEAWAQHAWTFFDNPWIERKSGKTHKEILDRELRRRGVTTADASIQREFFGRWIGDTESLWIKYNQDVNDFASLPNIAPAKYEYILGIDLGFVDADALAVLAWSDKTPVTYLVEEVVIAKQGLTELVDEINDLKKHYPITKMIIDEGGLGKKLAEEMRRRHGLPVQAADKMRKQETVAFLNDALRTGVFKAKPDSRFAQDANIVEIDRDKSRPDKIKVSDKYHSDIIDAVIYAFKESPAFAYEPPVETPKPGTDAWAKAEEIRMFEEAQEFFKNQEDMQRRSNGME